MSDSTVARPFIVGLTGGIGSGKSSAGHRFAELGATVVDVDAIAHQLTAAHGAAMAAIAAEFGPDVVTAEGALDRAIMRQKVFADPGARSRLEAILHPMIRAESQRQCQAATTAPYVILMVPLLLETGGYRDRAQRIAVVDCSEATQVSRTMARSHLSEDEVRRIMAAQVSRSTRLAAAADVIDNDGDLAHLQRQVDQLHQRYLELAAAH